MATYHKRSGRVGTTAKVACAPARIANIPKTIDPGRVAGMASIMKPIM